MNILFRGANEVKIGSSLLTRRGGTDANDPERPREAILARLACCWDFGSPNFGKCPKINLQKYNNVQKTIISYQKFIKENFKYVGDNFAYEARSIHYNSKKKSKGIYGSATKEDLKELKEEGIDAQIIPWIDENKN